MNILFVAPRVPYPADNGGKIRTINIAKIIAKNNKVTFIAFLWDDSKMEDLKELEKYFSRVIGVPRKNYSFFRLIIEVFISFFTASPMVIRKYFSDEMLSKLKELTSKEKFDIVHFDHLHMGQYREYLDGGSKYVLDEHNIEGVIWERMCKMEKNPIKKLFLYMQWRKFKVFEGELCGKLDVCLTVSEGDKRNLENISGGVNALVVENGADMDYFAPRDVATERYSMVFTGSMKWYPNEDGILFFVENIFPLIQKRVTGVKLYVVGLGPSKRIIDLASGQNIEVTGFVADVRPYVAKSTVFVVPLRIGGGSRLKIVEAMSMKKPIVSTSIGCEGIDVSNNENILVADEPEMFADAVVKLFGDRELAKKLGDNGRILVEKQYSWNRIGDKLKDIYGKNE